MKTTLLRFNSARPWRRLLIASSLSLGLAAASLQARPVPQNLSGGLGALVESDIAVKAQPNSAQFNGYATQQAADYASKAIQDTDTGRFLVDIYPTNNRVNAEKLVPMLQERFPSFTLTALDTKYHGVGVVEGFIALDDVPALGNMHEVRSVNLGLKPNLSRPVPPGGGIRPGVTFGGTDDYSYNIVRDPVHVHDLHATLLHCLGIDHTRLVYRFQGRDFRLTDVHGKVVQGLVG